MGLFSTKSDVAYRELRHEILSGRLEPGQVLAQTALAGTLGISTAPLREALRRLEAEGLVQLDAHRDARVSPLTSQEARDLLEVRGALEPWRPRWPRNGGLRPTWTRCARQPPA